MVSINLSLNDNKLTIKTITTSVRITIYIVKHYSVSFKGLRNGENIKVKKTFDLGFKSYAKTNNYAAKPLIQFSPLKLM